jgi:hypothetical protein
MGHRTMNLFRLTALAAALFMSVQPAGAQWQTPNHSVPIGRGGGVTGFGNAVPGTIGIPLTSNGATTDPSFAPARNAGIMPGAANTMKGSLDGATTADLPLVACAAAYQITQWVAGTGWQCGVSPTLSSRAVALTLNLAAFQAVQTLGYALPGDGGDAILRKVDPGTPFTDQFVAAASITAAGTGYINGVYQGVSLGGGTGLGCAGRVTVAGNVVTLIEISANYCPGYSLGDVLTPNNTNMGGSGSGAAYTVGSLSPLMGSFIDTGANRWHITTRGGTYPDVRQWGAKLNWNGSDVGVNNDRDAFRAAVSYVMYPFGSSAALVNGGTLMVPKGAALLCGGPAGGFTLVVPQGVILRGAGRWGGTQIVQCEAEPQNTHFIAVCGIYTTRGQFGCAVEEMALRSQAPTTASNIAVIYSISGQQFPLVKNMIKASAAQQMPYSRTSSACKTARRLTMASFWAPTWAARWLFCAIAYLNVRRSVR